MAAMPHHPCGVEFAPGPAVISRAHRGKLALALALLVMAALPSWAGAAPTAEARSRSALVVVGGGLEDPAIYREILRLGKRPGGVRVGILTTASDPSLAKTNGRFYEKTFRKHGASHAEWIPLDANHPEKADDAELAKRVAGFDVFFLGGGDQRRYTRVLKRPDGSDSAVLAAMRKAFEGRGAVIAGTSAGAAALVSGPMITGGESHDALARPRLLRDRRAGGLGVFRWGLIDTHFAERGRQGRLIRLAARRDTPLAFGVGEDTALVVDNPLGEKPRFRVIGTGGVGIFDLTDAQWSRGGTFHIEGVRAHYLTRGDRFRPDSRRPSFARWKKRDPRQRAPRKSDRADLFSAVDKKSGRRLRPRAFVRASMAAATSPTPVSGHPAHDKSWLVTLRRDRDTARVRGTRGGVKTESYRNVRIDIRARGRARVRVR